MRILIADDHPVVRLGVSRVLMDSFKDVVVGEAANGLEILRQLRRHPWDLVLLDITMPGRNGLDVLKQLKQYKPKLPVLLLSIHSENEYAIRALQGGASGYLTKEMIPEELVKAINKAIKGGTYVSDSLAEKLATQVSAKSELLSHETLSDREYEVMCEIVAGKTVSDVARELSLSVKTISTYRGRILQKMNLRNNAEIIRYGLKHNLCT